MFLCWHVVIFMNFKWSYIFKFFQLWFRNRYISIGISHINRSTLVSLIIFQYKKIARGLIWLSLWLSILAQVIFSGSQNWAPHGALRWAQSLLVPLPLLLPSLPCSLSSSLSISKINLKIWGKKGPKTKMFENCCARSTCNYG